MTSYVTVFEDNQRVDVKTEIDNFSNNHRLRAVFDCGINAVTVNAHGQFDIVKRNIKPSASWLNPSFDKRHYEFVELSDSAGGIVIGTKGLFEHDAKPDKNSLELTLLRCVGELGDWGEFLTPDALCQGKTVAEYSVSVFSDTTAEAAYKAALSFSENASYGKFVRANKGNSNINPFTVLGDGIEMSALKVSENKDCVIIRICNVNETEQTATITLPEQIKKAKFADMNEIPDQDIDINNNKIIVKAAPKKILTLALYC